MINYNPKNWLTLIFAIHKSDTLRMLWKELIYMGVFTLLVAFIKIHYFPQIDNLDKLIAVYSLVGFAISLLLVLGPIPLMIVGGKEEENGENW